MHRASAAVFFVVLALSSRSATAGVDPLFDQTRLHEVRIRIDPSDWLALQGRFRSNDYYAADITLDTVIVRQVGIRSRGNGSRSAEKPALKVDFNKYVAGQEYAGYKSLVLDNALQDASFLRERLAFAVFEGMGIPAPQNAFARLYINDAYWGLYQVTEPISKPFLKARVGEESGNLFDYDYAFDWDLTSRGEDPAAYVPVPFQPQTNEDHLDPSGIVDFVRAVNTTPDETFSRDMATWLDLDRFLTYVAVENALAESDGFVGRQGMNNFYLYQYGGQRRFLVLPWDKDTALQSESLPVYARVETNVLTRRLLVDPALQKVYIAALRNAVSSFVNPTFLLPRLENAYTQIREAALLDTHKQYTNDEFELAVGGIRGIIAAREADVLSQTGGR